MTAEAAGIAERLPPHADGWLLDLEFACSEDGQRDGWRAYRMSYDGEVSSGVIDCSRHGGGHMLSHDSTNALLDLKLMTTRWPCDFGYVPEWFYAEADDDEFEDGFVCNQYCGECEPELLITPLGLAVAHILREQEKTK